MELIQKHLTAEHESEARQIIEVGLTQHWGTYDASFNPDVTHLLAHYGDRLLTFWLNGEMVGTAAWGEVDAQTVFFTRVSVLEKYQGQGLGGRIMQMAEQEVAELGYQFAELETTTDWDQVVRFYLKLGYVMTHELDGDSYFRKALR